MPAASDNNSRDWFFESLQLWMRRPIDMEQMIHNGRSSFNERRLILKIYHICQCVMVSFRLSVKSSIMRASFTAVKEVAIYVGNRHSWHHG